MQDELNELLRSLPDLRLEVLTSFVQNHTGGPLLAALAVASRSFHSASRPLSVATAFSGRAFFSHEALDCVLLRLA